MTRPIVFMKLQIYHLLGTSHTISRGARCGRQPSLLRDSSGGVYRCTHVGLKSSACLAHHDGSLKGWSHEWVYVLRWQECMLMLRAMLQIHTCSYLIHILFFI